MSTTTRNGTTILDHDLNTPPADLNVPPAEAIAELLGDPLPPDWQEPLAIAGRQECLAGAAYAAADAALELLIVRVELRRRSDLGAEAPEVQRWVDALLDLDKARRVYAHTTQRRDAAAIIYEAAEFWGGATVATLVEGALAGVERERTTALLERVREESV